MATTTNYNWATPDDTDLVKDGASAIRTLGSAIDTTVFNNAGAAVAKSLIDAEGDLIVGDAADAVQRLAIGSNGNVLTVDTTVDGKIKWAAPAAGGKVLQVVQGTLLTQASSSSSTYADTGLSVSITPSSASNKVLILATSAIGKSNGSGNNGVYTNIVRASTQIAEIELVAYTGTALELAVPWAMNYLDSPNTTSATTYKIQFKNQLGDPTVYFNWQGATSTIIAMEIGA
jgi:hypothetical protein